MDGHGLRAMRMSQPGRTLCFSTICGTQIMCFGGRSRARRRKRIAPSGSASSLCESENNANTLRNDSDKQNTEFIDIVDV